ncbi:MAG: UUP1 family membrane protein, partial [Gammaproteobacteria bacterium]
MRRLQTLLLVTLLATAALALVYLKVTQLGLPLTPGQLEPVWAVEAKIDFDGQGRAALVKFDIPDELGALLRLDEYFVSRSYGLNIEQDKDDRRAEWSTRRARGNQRLYYRTEMVPRTDEADAVTPRDGVPKPPSKPAYEEPLASAIQDLLGEVRAESANVFTFVSQLLVKLNAANPDGNVAIIRGKLERGSEAWVEQLQYVLAGARITTRM